MTLHSDMASYNNEISRGGEMAITDETIKDDIAAKICNHIYRELNNFYAKEQKNRIEKNNYSKKLEEDPEKSLTTIFDRIKETLDNYFHYCQETKRKTSDLKIGKQWEITNESRTSIRGCKATRKTHQYKIYLIHTKNSGSILEISIEAFAIQVKERWRILTKTEFTKFSSR